MSILAFETLTQAILDHARRDPNRLALVFMDEDGSETKITSQQLHLHAGCYAGALQKAGLQPGDLVILVLRHSQDLLFAFWGAMYLGAIASIFPFLTEKLDPEIYWSRVKELVAHSRARAVITFPEFEMDLRKLLEGTGCVVLTSRQVAANAAVPESDVELPQFSSDRIAFLQHSSGTTGLQKGVALSHRAVLNQIEAYSQAIDLNSQDVVASWLPLYHDMGLIAGFVMPLVAGIPLVLMSPFKWVRDPKILLRAIHEQHATLCWLPNFAYNHSARVIRERELSGLDLSSMRAFINCSEPVYHRSHQQFLEKFTAFGIRKHALSTCYAMAENTFAVTQNPPGREPRVDWVSTARLQVDRYAEPVIGQGAGATPMVSCGFPIQGTEIRIVSESGELLPERSVGEIALRSDCMLSEYYRRPDLTETAVREGWYYTGDMGYLADGELFVSGRKKDLIIVGGKNIYPQDLEAIANTIPGIIPGRSVAFGLFDQNLGSENIVMVCELEDPAAAEPEKKKIEMLLRGRVVQQNEVALSDIRLVEKRWLIKTSSGKISRPSNREKYLREFIGN